jgi:ABC-type nickel/cobalt efflux system permease component RcnA
MGEFLKEYGEVLSQVGLGGFAVYALVNVWNRLIAMSDAHRQDTSARETAHREELKSRDDIHRQEMRELQERHDREKSELVSRNMDEHRERNRVQVMLAMSVAAAYAVNGGKAPDPYPDIDETGKSDPRKK